MQPQLVAWVQAQPPWVQAAAGVLAALVVIYLLPLVLVPEAGFDGPAEQLNAENDLRTTLVQALGGAIVLLATWRTLHVNREGQITERFSRAIEHLGHSDDKLDVRLGGIYALERIARESSRDRGPIIEVLTAFLREHARWNPDSPRNQSATDHVRTGAGNDQQPRLRADFQAVVTVLGRNQWAQEHHRDLREVDLRAASLSGAHLEGASLLDAHLEKATLWSTHLENAILVGAHLEGASLRDAHLEEACLDAAHLEEATLVGAHLKGAFLLHAHLEEATLVGAHFEGADLGGAYLEGANVRGAHFEGANLRDADLEGVIGLEDAHLEGAVGVDAWKEARSRREDKHTSTNETPAESDEEID